MLIEDEETRVCAYTKFGAKCFLNVLFGFLSPIDEGHLNRSLWLDWLRLFGQSLA